VATDDLRERVFGSVPGIFCEQLQIGVAHLHNYIAASANNPPTNLQNFQSFREFAVRFVTEYDKEKHFREMQERSQKKILKDLR
jgi:hypothetical protein